MSQLRESVEGVSGANAKVEIEECIDSDVILDPCNLDNSPLSWVINPYVGCAFGCLYCFGRDGSDLTDPDVITLATGVKRSQVTNWGNSDEANTFDTEGRGKGSKILFKKDAEKNFRVSLNSRPFSDQELIAFGTAVDPYQPAELRHGITRSLLEVLDEFEGLHFSITTKSPLILRDIELICRLGRKHKTFINVTLTTLDEVTANSLEIHAPSVQERLELIGRLASTGLTTRVYISPTMPGLNDSVENLEPIFARAVELRAHDVGCMPMMLPGRARKRFFKWLAATHPHLVDWYEQLYVDGATMLPHIENRLLAKTAALRKEHGFPRRCSEEFIAPTRLWRACDWEGGRKKDHFEALYNELRERRKSLVNHPAYEKLVDKATLCTFVEHHVFAVWDFMSLLKTLQAGLTCVTLPWIPKGDPEIRALINEIVAEEESDRCTDGRHLSHFELYLEAMEEIGADMRPIRRFIEMVAAGTPVSEALTASGAPDGAAQFVRTTMSFIDANDLVAVAAAFTFGRENVLPNIFRTVVQAVSEDGGFSASKLVWYLDRHIQLDGVDHAHLARRMLVQLCATDERKWDRAAQAGHASLDAREALWNAL